MHDVHVPPGAFLRARLDAISDDIVVDAVKVGMLANADVIAEVDAWLASYRPPIVVIDPVLIATSGDRLLDSDAETAIQALLHRADLVTSNLRELAVLVGRPLDDWDAALDAAEELSARIGAAVLIKGGHLPGPESPDALLDASRGIRHAFPGSRIVTTNTHGTGCSLSSAIATRLAGGDDTIAAVAHARSWLREALRAGAELEVCSGNAPVHHFVGLWERGGIDTRPSAAEIAAEWWERIADIRVGIDELPFIRCLADGTCRATRSCTTSHSTAQDALYLRDYARVLAETAKLAPTADE